jgi:galactokinase
MSAELVDATATVRSAFAERFGGQPEGLWVAPARVNLIGEHTDYNDGWVLPLAIDRRVTVAAAGRSGGLLRLLSLQRGEQVLRLAEVRPGAMNGWAAYVAGAVWSLAQEGTQLDGLDLVLTSDVPVGSGLSSSAAVECATLLAARDLYGGPDDRARLALVAQRAENEVVGVPCGIMDQMAAMACTANHALLLDCRSLAAEHVPLALDAADLVLLVIDTRVAHALADSAYADRRRTCQEAARILGVPSLRDATDADVETARDRLGGVRYRRARHVARENARVLAVVELLRRGQPERIGPSLTASHASLRDDYAVSAPELDTAVEAALAAGALGARMTGAGFGGCALALVPAGAAEQVAEAVTATFAAREFGPPEIFPAPPMDGARRLA